MSRLRVNGPRSTCRELDVPVLFATVVVIWLSLSSQPQSRLMPIARPLRTGLRLGGNDRLGQYDGDMSPDVVVSEAHIK